MYYVVAESVMMRKQEIIKERRRDEDEFIYSHRCYASTHIEQVDIIVQEEGA